MKHLAFMIVTLLLAVAAGAQSNPCIENTDFKVVVLGSSTAAGAGVSTPDSAWVNRYRNQLQSINPDNEVVNLAVGGYNTYKILPTGYVTPVGRPEEDTQRNITMALSHDPDVILVNLPSNDVSAGFSVAEQLFNLDTVRSLSIAAGVPIYICTTQPRNFSDSVKRQMQWDLKDSIWSKYSPEVIDFWNPFALSDHSIDPNYDSGDGVHMNDAAHALLSQKVVDMHLLLTHYTPYAGTDYSLAQVAWEMTSLCGDSSTTVQARVVSLGVPLAQPTWVHLWLRNSTSGMVQEDSLLMDPILQCEADTMLFSVDTWIVGQYELRVWVDVPGDTIWSNDTSEAVFDVLGHPALSLLNDTLCGPGNAYLEAVSSPSDSTRWYWDATYGTQPMWTGSVFTTGWLTENDTFYVEAVRGDQFYRGALTTTQQSNVNWNGAMFNLIPSEDMVLDSVEMKINTLGTQTVEMYYRQGGFQGHELTSTSWVFFDSVQVNVFSASDFISVPIGGLGLSQADTTAIYLKMADPNSDLSYRQLSAPMVRSDSVLSIQTGCGVSHGFSATYYPRDWNGKVHYHYGSRPGGECSTGRLPIVALLSDSFIDLGPDTIIDILDTLVLGSFPGFHDFFWQDGSLDSVWLATGPDLGNGVHFISLQAKDSLNCLREDEVVVAIADLVGLMYPNLPAPLVYPNPCNERLVVEGMEIDRVEVVSSEGKKVLSSDHQDATMDVTSLSSGVYLVTIYSGTTSWTYRVRKE